MNAYWIDEARSKRNAGCDKSLLMVLVGLSNFLLSLTTKTCFMKKTLFYLCLGMFAIMACSKKANKQILTHSATTTNSMQPAQYCPWNCYITALPYLYSNTLFSNGAPNDDLVQLLSGRYDPVNAHYDPQMNLINCSGQLQGACWTINYADTFYYNSQNKLQTILIDKSYDIPFSTCTLYPLNHYHWIDKCDAIYGQHLKSIGGTILEMVQTITVTLSRSDTVAKGHPVNLFTLIGEVFYYEYINKQLTFKRHTYNVSSTPTEFTYTYNNSGNLATIDIAPQGGAVTKHIYFGSYDWSKGIVSSSSTWQLLVSNYSWNNPTNWYINSTDHWQATYTQIDACFPHHADYTSYILGTQGFDIHYLCP
jgi:hypothetical protein